MQPAITTTLAPFFTIQSLTKHRCSINFLCIESQICVIKWRREKENGNTLVWVMHHSPFLSPQYIYAPPQPPPAYMSLGRMKPYLKNAATKPLKETCVIWHWCFNLRGSAKKWKRAQSWNFDAYEWVCVISLCPWSEPDKPVFLLHNRAINDHDQEREIAVHHTAQITGLPFSTNPFCCGYHINMWGRWQH